MTQQIRRTALVMFVLFAALFVNLNVVQLLRASELSSHPSNPRLLDEEFGIQRGPIVVGDQPVARSVRTEDGAFEYQRVYDQADLYSHVTGFFSPILTRSALEQAMNDELNGTPTEILAQNLAELFAGRDQAGNTVVLTIDPRVQAEAARALGGRTGAVVAIRPRTGAILAAYSSPTYDANVLSSHDGRAVNEAWAALNADPSKPLLDRTIRESFAPGSTFKVIVTAAALERGIGPEESFADPVNFDVPGTTADIGNYGGGVCNDGSTITLEDALRVSCNTTFARLGLELGADRVIDMAERFGFNRRIPYPVEPARSVIPKDLDEPSLAQSSIGQRDVRMTPLHASMIAAAIANQGTMMRPHVVANVLDPTGRVVRGAIVGPWNEGGFSAQVVPPRTAEQLTNLMVDVVDAGTGRAAAIPGFRVGGKTGTATVPDRTDTVWFIGFAEDEVAVAVVLPDAGEGATGGGVAAPIAKAVMEAALGLR